MAADEFELVREGLAALNDGDYDRAADMFAVDAELQRVDQFGVLHGREAIRKWLAPDAIQLDSVAVEEVERVGEDWLAKCLFSFHGTGSGAPVETTFYLRFTLRDGFATRAAVFTTAADAHAAPN